MDRTYRGAGHGKPDPGQYSQELKWREDRLRQTLETYLSLTRAASGRLIILPETALPLFLHQVPPEYLEALAAQARRTAATS